MIAVGVSSKGNAQSASSVTSAAVNSSASGSTFLIGVLTYNDTATITVADFLNGVASGNTYTQRGSTIYDGANRHFALFECANGTGGNTHTARASISTGTDNLEVFFLEMTGAATSPFDAASTPTTGFSGNPISSGNVTVTPPANGELLVSFFSTQYFASMTISEANGFTIQQSNLLGSTAPPAGAMGTQVVTSNGTYNASWSDSGTGSQRIAGLWAYKGAASTSVSIAPPTGAIGLTGQTPVPNQGSISSLGAGALALTGQTALQLLTVPAVTPAALILSGSVPLINSVVARVPLAGSVALIGAASALDTAIRPSVGLLPLLGQGSLLGWIIKPGGMSLSLSGNPPTIAYGLKLLAGALGVASSPPSLAGQIPLSVASIAWSGAAPLVGNTAVVTPGAGILALSGLAPVVSAGRVMTVGPGATASAGIALSIGLRIMAPSGALAFAAPAARLNLSIGIPCGNATLVGAQPAFAGQALTPATSILMLVGAPSASLATALTPLAGNVAAMGTPVQAVTVYAPWALYLRPLPAPLAQVRTGLRVEKAA